MLLFKRASIILSFLVITIVFAGCVPPPSHINKNSFQSGPPAKLNIYYTGEFGKVGYHMTAIPRANCPVTWNSNNPSIIRGELPPGLRLDGFDVVGTPQQPGNWNVVIRFTNIFCQGKLYPDQDVSVYFVIQGDAPRKLR